MLNIPDTVGYTLPTEFANLVKTVNERVVGDKDVTISVHCHNDLGLAVANSLAAIEAGATQIECTINGIGERAGNASLEELVMAMAVRSDKMPYPNNIDTTQLYPASQLLSNIVGFGVQPNKAIVGRNAFAHEAGIHQHGVLSNPLCYEIMTPESVGVPKNSIVLGKHSGRHALNFALRGARVPAWGRRRDLRDLYPFCGARRSQKKRLRSGPARIGACSCAGGDRGLNETNYENHSFAGRWHRRRSLPAGG